MLWDRGSSGLKPLGFVPDSAEGVTKLWRVAGRREQVGRDPLTQARRGTPRPPVQADAGHRYLGLGEHGLSAVERLGDRQPRALHLIIGRAHGEGVVDAGR